MSCCYSSVHSLHGFVEQLIRRYYCHVTVDVAVACTGCMVSKLHILCNTVHLCRFPSLGRLSKSCLPPMMDSVSVLFFASRALVRQMTENTSAFTTNQEDYISS